MDSPPSPLLHELDPEVREPSTPISPVDQIERADSEDDTDMEDAANTAGPQTVWVRPKVWEKLQVLKNDVRGTWSRFLEVCCEQMLATGLISPEATAKIREITERGGSDLVDDSGWRTSFGIGEPWPEAAANIAKMRKECELMVAAVDNLAETIEDHATAILDIELTKAMTEETL